MFKFLLLISRQGKVRLAKYWNGATPKEMARGQKELTPLVLGRSSRLCNFLEWKDSKIVYRKYASLYFVGCVDGDDNELICLEKIHHYVEVLDKYFGNVCELDIIFNFEKAYHLLDAVFMGGELQEVNKREILRTVTQQDQLADAAREGLDTGSPVVPGSRIR